MAQLTSSELAAIQEQLTAEQNLIEKYKAYAAQAQDPQIQTKCQQIAAQHQAHFTRLLSHLS